jgi:hypothetical protein
MNLRMPLALLATTTIATTGAALGVGLLGPTTADAASTGSTVSAATTGSTATTATTATTISTVASSTSVPCGTVWKSLPPRLRHDLAALRHETPTERIVELRHIRRVALRGGYGDRVEHWLTHRLHAVEARMPASLESDLRAARALPLKDQPAAYRTIWHGALAGDYGTPVQKRAERLENRWETCVATQE